MAQKQINLKSTRPILLDAKESLRCVNELRAEKGDKKKGKAPISIDDFVAGTKVLENRSADFGNVALSLHYLDAEQIPCTRRFPNFGLEVNSRSDIKLDGGGISITIDLTVKAGKKKWQMAEVQECIAVLSDKEARFCLSYHCDETTDSAGYSRDLAMRNSETDELGSAPIGSFFEVSSN